MNNNIKLSVALDLVNKEIAKLNSILASNHSEENICKLNYLLDLKKSINTGNFDGINDFLNKYKENKL